MNRGCLSDLALEALILKERPESDAHAAACRECQARLARMEAEGVTFRRQVYPQTIDAVLAPRVSPWRQWLVPLALAVPAAAAVLMMGRPHAADAPPEMGFQSKGSARAVAQHAPLRLGFHVFAGGPAGVHELADGARVAGETKLRFSVEAPEHCWLSVVSVDASGTVSQLYPTEAAGIEVPRPSLPGGTVLDGGAGPERIFALCSPRPTPVASLTEGARSSLSKNAETIRALQKLPGLPGDVLQDTVLVERSP
jgi:hypothetical protein